MRLAIEVVLARFGQLSPMRISMTSNFNPAIALQIRCMKWTRLR
jgi:hypothetical protein